MFNLLRPFIFNLDPEIAHDLAIKALKFNYLPKDFFDVQDEKILEIDIFDIKFKNPIGLAAGFDKSAEVYNSLFKFGFGFIEVGTVTPKQQFGNPKPRVFRLEKDLALINRLGFNNDGLDVVISRINQDKPTGVLGVNIGPNKDTTDKIEDYLISLPKIDNLGNYVTINISSPNTEGLRDLHEKEYLHELLSKINQTKKKMHLKKPVFLKISPDITDGSLNNIIETIFKFKIQGVIISNTTDKNREKLVNEKKSEVGGLSGKPLKNLSTALIKKFYKESAGKIPVIGVGGVDSGKAAFEKISSGASLVQLYTGMVYHGPTIAKKIKLELIDLLKRERVKKIADIVGKNI